MSTKSFVAGCFLYTLLVTPAGAANLSVNSTDDDGNGTCSASQCTLRDAISSAASGDTIVFSLPPNSAITLTNGQLSIDKTLTIVGPGASLLTVQRSAAEGTPEFRIFDIGRTGFVRLSGLTVANGRVSDGGGGLRNSGYLQVLASTITGNAAGLGGGGIANVGLALGTLAVLSVGDTTLSSNSANSGGGIDNSGGASTSLHGSTIFANYAEVGGGLYVRSGGSAGLDSVTISGNSAFYGGGINNSGSLRVFHSTLFGNSASFAGGGAINTSGSFNVGNTIIALNTADTGPDVNLALSSQGYNLIGNNKDAIITARTGDQIGGAASPINPRLSPLQDNGGPTLTHALLPASPAIDRGNVTGLAGPGTRDQRGFPRPVDSPTIANAGDGSDIGAYEVQPDELVGCSEANLVVNNNGDGTAGSLRSVIANACPGSTIAFAPNVRGTISLTGGELSISRNLTINGPGARVLTISGSNASRVFNVAAGTRVAISGLTIADGRATESGGAIFNSGTLTLQNCAISNNSGGSGGGAANGGRLSVYNCTFAGNRSTGNGGALRNTGSMDVDSSTFYDNIAFSSGAIASFVTSGLSITLTVINSTISGNRATDPTNGTGGGIFSGMLSTGVLRNNIVANNFAAIGPDVSGEFISTGFNLIGNGATAMLTAQPSDQIGTAGFPINPLLGPLQDNGGPTPTMALLPGSRAIDRGYSGQGPTDQRGSIRPIGIPTVAGGDGSDIGAFEIQGPDIVEFYNAALDHYFITWLADEIAKLDAGTEIKGWARTGRTLKTYVGAQNGTSAVCRFYIPPELGDSHFFGRGTAECNATGAANPSFVLEEPAFMHMFLPSMGVCPVNTVPVYRVFSNRADANHRYMMDSAVRDAMVASGWLAEGDGPDLVVMCARGNARGAPLYFC